ncbi:MAG: bifunctional methylenetetrahydrofolate dehydrogenase/methenyltetrahydrofolate cyclohydrolase FolD [bacterium]|nr:bifunctional methylenetetrahydrofolate dehydrogenase/methenyltetrahydrofolate cyclohydrolase FolD [bacterium]
MEIINGTQVAFLVKEKLKDDIKNNFIELNRAVPKLAVILVGNDPASLIYVEGKSKACSQVGISSQMFHLDEKTTENELREVIEKLNKDKTVDGILLQLPLPKHFDENKMVNLISPEKDVDGLTRVNLGKLISNDNTGLFSCTPSGIIELLKYYNVNLKGKDVVIINRSLLVGKPLAFMFLNEDSTVTICHSKTKDLKEKTLKADIIVVAVGKKGFLTQDMVKDGAIVIDVGINRNNEAKKVCGDVDFENVSKKASLITPVPGGVGPMTIAMLLKNTYLAAIKNR